MDSSTQQNQQLNKFEKIDRIISDLNRYQSSVQFNANLLRTYTIQDIQNVYSVGSIEDYSQSYKNGEMIQAILTLESNYSLWLGIRGDGNCFYRSIIILYLIQLFSEQGVEDLEQFILKVDSLNDIQSDDSVQVTQKSQKMKEIFLVFLLKLRDMKMSNQEINLMKLINIYNALPELDYSVIVITRYLIYNTYQKNINHPQFKMFIEEDMSKQIPKILLKYQEYAEDIIIPLAAETFKVELIVQNLYRQSANIPINTESLNYLPFSSTLNQQQSYPQIHVLFTKGHYEALITNAQFTTNSRFYNCLNEPLPSFLFENYFYEQTIKDISKKQFNQKKNISRNVSSDNKLKDSINQSQSTKYTENNLSINQSKNHLSVNSNSLYANSNENSFRSKTDNTPDKYKYSTPQKDLKVENILKSDHSSKEQLKGTEQNQIENTRSNLHKSNLQGDSLAKDEIIQSRNEKKQELNGEDINKFSEQKTNQNQEEIIEGSKQIQQKIISNKQSPIKILNSQINEEIEHLEEQKQNDKDEQCQSTDKEVSVEEEQCSQCNQVSKKYILVYKSRHESLLLPFCVSCLHNSLDSFYFRDDNSSYLINTSYQTFRLDNENVQKLVQIIQNEGFKFEIKNKKYQIFREEKVEIGQKQKQEDSYHQCFDCIQNSNLNVLVFQSFLKRYEKHICNSCLEKNIKILYLDSKYLVYGQEKTSFYLDEENLNKVIKIIHEKLKYELNKKRYTILRQNESQTLQQNQNQGQITSQICFDCRKIQNQNIKIFISELRQGPKYVCIQCLEKNLRKFYNFNNNQYLVYGENELKYFLDETNVNNLLKIIQGQFKYEAQGDVFTMIRESERQIQQLNTNERNIKNQYCLQCKQISQELVQISQVSSMNNNQQICLSCLEKNLDSFSLSQNYISLKPNQIFYLDKLNSLKLLEIIKARYKYEESKERIKILRNDYSFTQSKELECFYCKQLTQEYILVTKSYKEKTSFPFCIECLQKNIVEYYTILKQITCLQNLKLLVNDEQTSQNLQKFIKFNFKYENKQYTMTIQRDSTSDKKIISYSEKKAIEDNNQIQSQWYLNSPLLENLQKRQDGDNQDKNQQQDQGFTTPKKQNSDSTKIIEKEEALNKLSSEKQLCDKILKEDGQSDIQNICLYCGINIQDENKELVTSSSHSGYLCEVCVDDILQTSFNQQLNWVLINNRIYNYSKSMIAKLQNFTENKQKKQYSYGNQNRYKQQPNLNNSKAPDTGREDNQTKIKEKSIPNKSQIEVKSQISYKGLDTHICSTDNCFQRAYFKTYLVIEEDKQEEILKYCRDCLINKFLLSFEKGQQMLYVDDQIYKLDKEAINTLEQEKDIQQKLIQNIENKNNYRETVKCLNCYKYFTKDSGINFCNQCRSSQAFQSQNRTSYGDNSFSKPFIDRNYESPLRKNQVTDNKYNQSFSLTKQINNPDFNRRGFSNATNQMMNKNSIKMEQQTQQDNKKCFQCNTILYLQTQNGLCSSCDYYYSKILS